MTAPAPAQAPRACLNCDEPLLPRAAALPPRFCPACGQETHVKPPTLGEFVQQFGGAYFATEGALWRTLKLLLIKPGELTRLYLAGRRKHFVLPLRLYLTVSLLVLLLLRGVATVNIDDPASTKVDAGDLNNTTLNIGAGRAGMKNGVYFCENLPVWLCKRIQQRLDLKPEAFVEMIRKTGERFVSNLGGALFVLLPSFALCLKLVYYRRHLRYTEHLVFALHVHTFWFLMLALALVPLGWMKPLALLAIPAYALLAMGRVYGGRWWPRLLRAALVSVLYLLTLVLAMVGIGLWSFLV